MNTELHAKLKGVLALSPQTLTNGTVVGPTLDSKGFDSLKFNILAGTITDGSHEVQLFEGDLAGMSDEAQVVAPNELLHGTLPTLTSADSDTVKSFGTASKKRYHRIKIVTTGAASGGVIGAGANQGHPFDGPAE